GVPWLAKSRPPRTRRRARGGRPVADGRVRRGRRCRRLRPLAALCGEFLSYLSRDALWFRFELPVGEAEDGVAGRTQVEVAFMVDLEGNGAAVVGEGVSFDHEALGAP